MADEGAMPTSAEPQCISDELPWPNVRGKRCLDIGPADGHLDSELKRRGADEVVVIDLADEHAIHDLDPDATGTFDVVVCSGLTRHLRDPIRALEATRRITAGMLLSVEQIELWPSVLGRGKPLYTLRDGEDGPRLICNGAGHKQLLHVAGFTVERAARPFTVPRDGHPDPKPGWRERLDVLGTRFVTGSWEPGVLHRALLARPRG